MTWTLPVVTSHVVYHREVFSDHYCSLYMWHSMVYRSRGNTLSLISALYLWATLGCDVVCCQGILAWYVRGLPSALLPGASLITQFAHSTGTITQLCLYMLVQPSLCRCNCDADRCSYMWKSVILLFMGCATRQILFIFGATPICVESYLDYYNVYI